MTAREILLGSGRAGQQQFFFWTVGLFVAAVVLVAATVETDPVTGAAETSGGTMAGVIFIMWLGLMNVRRRVHDINGSIVIYGAVIFPGVNLIAGLYLLLTTSVPEDNQHGPAPFLTPPAPTPKLSRR